MRTDEAGPQQSIRPGVYDDGHGGMHIDVGEMLRANGYADTPENRAVLVATAERIARERDLKLDVF